MEDPPGDLRARIRDGDAAAFGELFDACAASVYNHAFRLTGNWAAAEDVMSLTFLEAWRTRGRISAEGGSLRPWLLGVATNVARSQGRAARRHRAVLARVRPESVPDFAEDVGRRLDHQAQIAAIYRSLPRLREGEREVLALCVWSGLSYAEAAEALGIPVGTVRSRLSRARARLERLAGKELRRDSRELTSMGGKTRGGNVTAFPSAPSTFTSPDWEARR